jgi:hypothetical protein
LLLSSHGLGWVSTMILWVISGLRLTGWVPSDHFRPFLAICPLFRDLSPDNARCPDIFPYPRIYPSVQGYAPMSEDIWVYPRINQLIRRFDLIIFSINRQANQYVQQELFSGGSFKFTMDFDLMIGSMVRLRWLGIHSEIQCIIQCSWSRCFSCDFFIHPSCIRKQITYWLLTNLIVPMRQLSPIFWDWHLVSPSWIQSFSFSCHFLHQLLRQSIDLNRFVFRRSFQLRIDVRLIVDSLIHLRWLGLHLFVNRYSFGHDLFPVICRHWLMPHSETDKKIDIAGISFDSWEIPADL